MNNLCRNNNNLILDNLQQLGNDLEQQHQQQMQSQQQQSQDGAHGTSASSSSAFPLTNMTLAADILGFHTNPINLGVNAEFAAKSKTQPKGNKKRSRQMMMTTTAATTTMHNNNSEAPLLMPSSSTLLRRSGGRSNNCNNNQNNQGPEDDENENDDDDDNLNVASGNVRSKSTSKFFEALKENVRCEVSNLIETNDLRPYFLIQLFRDLQLMSSSDSTRHQTLQSIQNMYNRYVESTIQEEAMFGGGQRVGQQPQLRRGQADEEEEDVDGDEDEDRQNLSHDEFDNRMLVNDLRMEAKTENDLATQNREARSRRDNQAEDSLRRQNKRRYRNRVNEIASKQNFLGQRLGLGFLPGTSSASSQQSTPIVSGYFLFNIIQ